MIPVTDGKADDANVHNRAYLDSILVEMRLIDSIQPDLTTEFFGKEFASPITLAAVSHLNKVLPDKKRKPMQEKAKAAKDLHVLAKNSQISPFCYILLHLKVLILWDIQNMIV